MIVLYNTNYKIALTMNLMYNYISFYSEMFLGYMLYIDLVDLS